MLLYKKPLAPKLLFGTLLAGALALGGLTTNTFAATPITHLMDNTPISDEAFATCVYDAYHTATGKYFHELDYEFNYPDELAKITSLNCENQGITNVDGLELLTGLVDLRLTNNSIEEIDVSALTFLQTLYITYNPIKYIDLSYNLNLETFFSNQTTPDNITNSAWVLTPAQPTRSGDNIVIDFSTVGFLYTDSTHRCAPIDTEKFSFNASTGLVTVLDEDAISSTPIELSCSNGTFIALYHLFRDFLFDYYFDDELDYDKSGHEYALYGDTFFKDDYVKDFEGYELVSTSFWNDEVAVSTTRSTILQPRFYHYNSDEFTFTSNTRYAGIKLFYKSIEEESDDSTPTTPNTGFFTNEDGGVNVSNILLTLASLSIVAFLILGISLRIKKHAQASRF